MESGTRIGYGFDLFSICCSQLTFQVAQFSLPDFQAARPFFPPTKFVFCARVHLSAEIWEKSQIKLREAKTMADFKCSGWLNDWTIFYFFNGKRYWMDKGFVGIKVFGEIKLKSFQTNIF